MFCSNCGEELKGNFCSGCGAPAGGASNPPEHGPQDWSGEVRYEVLVRIPEVRDRIKKHASMSKKGLSGEELLAFFDKVVPLGFSLEKLGGVVQPISARLGVKTGKGLSETLPNPPGKVIVAALCSLDRRGQVLRQVQQYEDGCLLEAALPSDMWSFAGTLYISARKSEAGTHVEATTKIEGQLFDWGKSRRSLEALFSDLKASPA